MNHYKELAHYRMFGKFSCPYCYRHTYKGLEFRRANPISVKRILFRHTVHKFYEVV